MNRLMSYLGIMMVLLARRAHDPHGTPRGSVTDSHRSAARRNGPGYGSRTSMGFRHRVESRGLAAFGGIVLAVGLFHAVTGDGAGAIPYVLLATFVAVPVLYRSVSQRLVLSPNFVEVHRLTGVRRWPLDGSCSLARVDARSARRGTDRRFAELRLVNKSGHALKLSGIEWVDSQIWAQRLMEEVRRGAVRGTGTRRRRFGRTRRAFVPKCASTTPRDHEPSRWRRRNRARPRCGVFPPVIGRGGSWVLRRVDLASLGRSEAH